MIIGGNKGPVVANIQAAVQAKRFNQKVEVDDPSYTNQEREQVLATYLKTTATWRYRERNWVARGVANIATGWFNRQTQIVGLDNLASVHGGAIITSNHFNPLENTVIRHMVHQRHQHQRLYIVCEDTNYAMTGPIGFLMRNYDTIPVSPNLEYMGNQFPRQLETALAHGDDVLIYPEAEMWFNYRKPRPLKRGAYYYAASLQVPIISCFVEIVDEPRVDNAEFNQVRWICHVLPVIYPDPKLSVRANSFAMMRQDYAQKQRAYEQAYQQALTYDFSPQDIAGWRGH